MALTILPFLIEVAKKKHNVLDKSLILVATSGDTGGAALSSFMKNDAFDTVVLYPNKGVSEIQEKQMLYYTNARTKAYAVDGNFDDCQNFVKKVFGSYPKDNGVIISSANSINIGRLIPQVVYYVYAYMQGVKTNWLKFGESFDICVPTGNFGDIFAGYIAKIIGVPINKLVCASNVNNVLTDFFMTGTYDKNREFKKSNSPAMDILISSNLERLVYLATGRNGERVKEFMDNLNSLGKYSLNDTEKAFLNDFGASFSTEDETILSIRKTFEKYSYLIDPHTAVAFDCYNKLKMQSKTLIVSTASPYKFPNTVAKALQIDFLKPEFELIKDIAKKSNTIVPQGISKLEYSNKKTIVKTRDEIQDIVLYKNLKVEVKVPATSANLGCCFDTAGVALSLYNSFVFEKSDKDEAVNFKGKIDNNLVLKAYKKLFEVSNKEYIPVKITLKKCEILSSHGLGSSASCIVAGVLGANYILKNTFNKEYLLSVMSSIEGHPDNVTPAYLGGLTISYTSNGVVKYVKANVNSKLKVFACMPDFDVSTKTAREILPNTISFEDCVQNVRGSALFMSAFENGDMSLIKEVFNDKMHEPYRYPLIKGGLELKKVLENQGFAVAISGAGPSLLAITDKDVSVKKVQIVDGVKWYIKPLRFDKRGAVLYD